MKKLLIVLLVLFIGCVLSCDNEVFTPMIRNNPDDPGYDPKDPNNKPDKPPVAPGMLKGVHSPDMKAINLTWQDNSSYETGYIVLRSPLRSPAGEDDFTEVYREEIKDLKAWTDGPMETVGSYKYQVRAFNAHGLGALSNIVEVTVDPPGVVIKPKDEIKLYIKENEPAVFSIYFTAIVNDFGDDLANEFKVINGLIDETSLTGSGNSYSLSVMPVDEGDVIVQVLAGAAHLPNTEVYNVASTTASMTCDGTVPTISGFVINDNGGYCGKGQAESNIVKARLSDAKDNIRVAEIQFTGKNDALLNKYPITGVTPNLLDITLPTDPALDGEYTVTVHVIDVAGNECTKTDSTILDNTKPVISSFVLNGGNDYTNQRYCNAAIECDDANGAGVVEYALSTNGTLWTSWTILPTSNNNTYELTNIDLGDKEEEKKIYIKIRDAVGNVSVIFSDSITLNRNLSCDIGDIIPKNNFTNIPVNTAITITFNHTINNYKNGSVQLKIQGSETNTILLNSSTSLITKSSSNGHTIIIDPYSDFSYGTTYYEITIKGFTDNYGNTCNFSISGYKFTTEALPLHISAFSLAEGTTVINQSECSATIQYSDPNWNATDGSSISEYAVSSTNDITMIQSNDWKVVSPGMIESSGVAGFYTLTINNVILGNEDGLVTLYVWLKDKYDIVSNNFGQDSITLDTKAPDCTGISPQNGDDDVPVNANIVITFNEPITNCDNGSIEFNSPAFIFDSTNSVITIGTGSNSDIVTINPRYDFNFAYDTLYSGINITGFSDASGNICDVSLTESEYSFTTVAENN